MKLKFDVWSWCLKFEVDVWSWSLKLKFDVEVWILKLKFEVWSWSQSLKLKFKSEVWCWNFKRLVCGIILNELFGQIFARTALSSKYLLEWPKVFFFLVFQCWYAYSSNMLMPLEQLPKSEVVATLTNHHIVDLLP